MPPGCSPHHITTQGLSASQGFLGAPASGGNDNGGGADTVDDMLDFFLKDEPILD